MNMSMKKNRSFSSSRIALMALGVSVLTACGGQSGRMGDDEFTVKEITATSSNQMTKYPATIKGLQDIEIRPQVSGFIVKLCVDEGATVRKGQALFQIDPTQYQAAFDQAAAGVESAKANLKTLTETEANKKMLHEQKIISDFEYQTAVNNLLTAKASLAQAEASYTAAKQNLGFCTVTSPSDGVIGTFPYRIGALVSAGTLKEQLEKMPEVQLELADGSIYAEKGKIDAVSGVIDQTTGSVSMRAIFPNKQNILRSGGMANVIFPYTMENVLLVPQSATVDIQDKKFVYVLQPDSTVKYTEIQISNLNDGKNYIVLDGLKSGDKIAVEGVTRLNDGMKITPISQAQKEAKYQQALKDQREGNIASAFN